MQHDRLIQRPRLLTQHELLKQADSRHQEAYALEKYRTLVDIEVKKLEKSISDYRKSPETHPKYSEEWKLFWCRKYKELLAEGKDANGYDYKPDWIEFWVGRMEELHKINVDKTKDDLRKKLELSLNAIANMEKERSKKEDNKIVLIEQAVTKASPTPPKQSKRSTAVIENLVESKPTLLKTYPSAFEETSRDYDRDQIQSKSLEPEFEVDSMDVDAPINLISVLRFLTVLKIELGLFADSIFDLLAKSTAVEKFKPNAADELLFVKENYNILETVKEKFKGVLIVKLISADRIVLVQRAIEKITSLNHEISSRKPSMSTIELQNLTKNMKIEESIDDSVDPKLAAKKQIASIIAEKLMKEGITNKISAEELENLVDSMVMSLDNPTSDEEMEVAKEPETTTKPEENSSELDSLTNEDLQTLLRNFSELTPEEQEQLELFLKKIEETDAKRVEKLRKYINMGNDDDSDMDTD
jgi:zinc finger CCCH domain-containing protein 13